MTNLDNHIHIIAFDVPWPPDYGGVIDVFYKLKALAEHGIKIHLHCFRYGRNKALELESFCEEVCYYSRKSIFLSLLSKTPYIVASRRSNELFRNLVKNKYPIFFEGLHTSFYLNRKELKDRMKVVRMHNIEYIYYLHLAKVEKNPIKQFYFVKEASRLKKFQFSLNNASKIAAISPSDQSILQIKHNNSFYLPVFHANEQLTSQAGKGDFVLYHGNLGVGENNEAALFLVRNVFNKIKNKVIIAGSNPSAELIRECRSYCHIQMLNPDTDGIYNLIHKAHVNVLPTFQDTGIKLKLLNALYKGRHCIVNSKMVRETGLEELCIIAESATEFIHYIEQCFTKEFSKEEISQRKEILDLYFNNKKNAKTLIEQVFGSNS